MRTFTLSIALALTCAAASSAQQADAVKAAEQQGYGPCQFTLDRLKP